MVAKDFCCLEIRFMPFKMACRVLKEVQTSKASQKTPFLKYGIIDNAQQKFVKRQKCEPGHEKLRPRAQSTRMLQ